MTTATLTGAPLLGSPQAQARTLMISTQITDRLATLLTACQGVYYPSGVGAAVFIGQTKGAEQQAPCVFVIPERATSEGRYHQEQVSRDYRIAAFARLSDHPSATEHGLIDQIIADVRRALEARDAVATIGLVALGAEIRFQGATPGYHEDGGQLVGAALQYQLIFTQASPA